MICRWKVLLLCAAALAMSASSVVAEEPYLDFLRELQRNGYGEMALHYLDQLAAQPRLPGEVKDVLDLERSKSFRVAAAEAYNLDQRNERLAEADKLLAKFLKEHPGHPAGATALMSVADELLQRAQMSLGQSRATRNKEEAEQFRLTARKQFSEANQQLKQILTQLNDQLAKLPQPAEGMPPSNIQLDLEFAILEAKFKSALAEYFTAQTFADLKDPARKKTLEVASKSFDAIFQQHRGSQGGFLRAAFLGHMWHGKTLEELGDEETALEVYDEVLVVSPEGNATEDDASLFGQAALFRFRMLARKAKPTEILREGEEWLRTHDSWAKTVPFQGIAMEVAKVRLTDAEKATGVEQKKRLREVMTMLLAISKVDSEYKHEALLLRRECQEKLGGTEGGTNPEEELALGDSAVAAKEWTEATGNYQRALDLATKAKNQKLIDTAKQRLTQVRYQLAVELYNGGKHEEALKAAGAIVREAPEDPAAIAASGVAVAAAAELYSAAKEADKPAALDRLVRVADYTIEHWPDKAEADDARMALARAKLLKDDHAAALELLSKVNPRSKRFGAAQQVAGQLYWKQYVDGRRSGDAAVVEQLPKFRQEARQRLEQSLMLLKQEQANEKEPLPATVFDAQLLLAEVTLEDQGYESAAKLFDPLVAHVKAHKPEKIEPSTMKVFIGDVRAHLGAKQINAAGDAAEALIEISDDTEQVNSVLVDFTKLIGVEVKKADAEITKLEAAPPVDATQLKTATEHADATRKVLARLIEKLVVRQQVPLAGLVYLGDAAAGMSLNSQARSIYERVMKQIDKGSGSEDAATAQKAATRIRAQLISLLRNEGKFEEAEKQVDALIKAHPNALEPLMEKGRILQSWAEKDPKRYDACVAHWSTIRQLLGRMKQRPPEYYEVLYSAAYCSLQQAKTQKDKSKALDAEKMLKSTLTLSPKLNGPDMVAKYEALLVKAVAMRNEPTVENKGTKATGKAANKSTKK